MAYPFSITLHVPAPGIAAGGDARALLDAIADDLAGHQADISERDDTSFEFAFPFFRRPEFNRVHGWFEFGRASLDHGEVPSVELSFTPSLVATWVPILFAFFAGWQITHSPQYPMSPVERSMLSTVITAFYCVPVYLVIRFWARRYLRALIDATSSRQAT